MIMMIPLCDHKTIGQQEERREGVGGSLARSLDPTNDCVHQLNFSAGNAAAEEPQ